MTRIYHGETTELELELPARAGRSQPNPTISTGGSTDARTRSTSPVTSQPRSTAPRSATRRSRSRSFVTTAARRSRFAGSTQVHSATELALWARKRDSGLATAIVDRPRVSLVYYGGPESPGPRFLSIEGRARVAPELDEQVWEAMIEGERQPRSRAQWRRDPDRSRQRRGRRAPTASSSRRAPDRAGQHELRARASGRGAAARPSARDSPGTTAPAAPRTGASGPAPADGRPRARRRSRAPRAARAAAAS